MEHGVKQKAARTARNLGKPTEKLKISELRSRFKALGVDCKGKSKSVLQGMYNKLDSITKLVSMAKQGLDIDYAWVKRKAQALFAGNPKAPKRLKRKSQVIHC